jgi:hydroxymethylpyrimidine/phosphomethylpyrimidine kinase
MIKNVLSIAGVDPSGGAGLLADLKTFSALGVYGTGVVAALTAQNTRGVTGVHTIPAAFVVEQIDTLFADVRIDATKIGMLGTAEVTLAVADALQRHGAKHIVLDPVMVSKSGHHLLAPDAVDALRRELMPLAEIVTPNLPEAGVLLNRAAPATLDEMRTAARDLHALGSRFVLLKGGHLDDAGESIDILDNGTAQWELHSPRIRTTNTHGTGCTLSSALAACLARSGDVLQACREAKAYLGAAIAAAYNLQIGSGHGPVHHFHALWKESGN